MTKDCHPFDLPADIGLAARADSPGELLEALAEGLADLICPRVHVRAVQTIELDVQGDDWESLAVAFLWNVMDLIQADHKAVASVTVTRAQPTGARASVACEPIDLSRHEILTEVKAVTYHQLEFRPDGERWVGRVVLDL
ncbi:MAG: archease [Planctomycetota bacterium]|nr:archease [Planctomycetota bacterium]